MEKLSCSKLIPFILICLSIGCAQEPTPPVAQAPVIPSAQQNVAPVAPAPVPPKSAFNELEFIAKAALPEGFRFKNTEVGGLSGIVRNPDKGTWFLASGDHNHQQAPRFYEFKFKVAKGKKNWGLQARPVDVVSLQIGDHPDLKGITWLPWGNLLLASEGTGSLKARTRPLLLDVKTDGTWVRNFEFPEEYLPEPSGHQTKGAQVNRGPEGLTSSGDASHIWSAIEAPLLQDLEHGSNQIRILQYEMPEAWIIKPTKSYHYPLGESSQGAILSERGVSELCWLRDQELLVMERAFEVSMQKFGYSVKIFHVNLNGKEVPLKKRLVLDLKSLGVRIPNFEGMAPGPDLPDGRKTLLIASNNNFKKGEKSEFWLFAWKAE